MDYVRSAALAVALFVALASTLAGGFYGGRVAGVWVSVEVGAPEEPGVSVFERYLRESSRMDAWSRFRRERDRYRAELERLRARGSVHGQWLGLGAVVAAWLGVVVVRVRKLMAGR